MTPGQTAFDAYNASRGGVNHLGKPTPPWDQLPEEIQAAWHAAAMALSPPQDYSHLPDSTRHAIAQLKAEVKILESGKVEVLECHSEADFDATDEDSPMPWKEHRFFIKAKPLAADMADVEG